MKPPAAALRARAWLDVNLFPDAPPGPQITTRRLLVALGVAVALVAIQLARMWPSVPLNTVWAEDGQTYLADVEKHGFFQALATPHNGYLQIVPRLVVGPIAALPLNWFAALMTVSGAAIVTGCAFVVWRASAGHIGAPYLRAALAAMVVLVPVANVEMYDNVVNTIWFLLFVSFWLLLWRPNNLATTCSAAGLLLLATLSNGGVILLIPLGLLRAIAIRDRGDALIVGAFGVGTLAQVAVILGQPQINPPHWTWSFLPAYAQRVVGGAFTGDEITGALWKALGTSVEVALAATLVVLVAVAVIAKGPPARAFVPIAVAISLAMFLASGYERDLGKFLPWPNGSFNNYTARYVAVPVLLLLSALFVAIDAPPRLAPAAVWNTARRGAPLVLLGVALTSFNASDSVRGSPTWSAALSHARAQCIDTPGAIMQVPIAPGGFIAVRLSCRALK